MSFMEINAELTHSKVMEELNSANHLKRMLGIAHSAWINDDSDECKARLEFLKSDHEFDTLTKITVSDFAVAALDILNFERYTGDKPLIRELISCKLNCP